MSSNPDFDRWYAAKNAKFLVEPSHHLETFGNTLVNYHLISELSDNPGKIRIREGRLEAHQPRVIAPHFVPSEMEGFGEEAREYFEFLKQNEDRLRILQYGYRLSQEADCWLNPGWCSTKDELRSVHPLFSDFPVLEKKVWNNTRQATEGGGNAFWETGPVCPDVILEDLCAIFDGADGERTYFIPVL